jgi:sugar phosphate permease
LIRTGLLVMTVCFGLYPFARGLTDLYVLHALLALGLVLSGLLVNVVLLSNWFNAKRGIAIGALAAASSAAGALMPVAIAPLVNSPEFGWRWGVGALAIAFVIFALIPGFTVLREKPSLMGLYPDGAATPPPWKPATTGAWTWAPPCARGLSGAWPSAPPPCGIRSRR